MLFRDRATRETSEAQLRRLSASRPLISALSALADAAEPPDLEAAQQALLAQLISEDIVESGSARQGRLRLVVERMVADRR